MSCHSLGSVSHLSVSITKCPSYWIHFSNPGALRAEKMLGSSLQRLVSAKVLLMPSTSFMSNPQTNKSFKQNPVRIRASILHPGLPAQQVRCLQRSEGRLTVREAAAASQHHVISLQWLPCSVSWDDPVGLQLSLNGLHAQRTATSTRKDGESALRVCGDVLKAIAVSGSQG